MRSGDNELEGGSAMIQVYTGEGKGKTTAAFGLALRAAGAGLKVYIGQFLKKGDFSEINALKKIEEIKIEQFGSGSFVMGKPKEEDIKPAKEAFAKVKEIISGGGYDVIILDEINVAVSSGLIKLDELIGLIKGFPAGKELILTGRNADDKIKKIADLVSEIKEVKHYFKKGVKARKGIEF
jgi:cob(I)alamin adenosyltransferase